MILELHIRNVSIISELTLEFSPGLTILTGETGAGKSILLGALSLLLGERASSDLIRSGCENASVEALFDTASWPQVHPVLENHGLPACEENTLLIKRELYKNGRSKCYVNGSLCTLAVLQVLADELVDLHGQHEHQSLLHKDKQRDLLDEWAGLLPMRTQVQAAYQALKSSREARERLAMNEAERARQLDLLRFQAQEISDAAILPNEIAQLADERSKLTHAERLMTTVQACLEILHRREEGAVRDGIAESAKSLVEISAVDSQFAALADDLNAAEAQVADVVDRLSDFMDSFEADPQRLETVEERLDLLHKLQRKYGNTEEEILAYGEKVTVDLAALDHRDEELERLAKEEKKLAEKLSDLSHRLSSGRQRAGKLLSERMASELKELGFKQAIFEARVIPREASEGWVEWDGKTYTAGPLGVDDVEFFIAPNPGEQAKPVAKTASGGELSRLMLALKVIAASASRIPTLIFDEVDAGIGGATAEIVGKKLQWLGSHQQVMVITHLPQIARFAQQHFRVEKNVEHGRTTTAVRLLDFEARVEEMARLLAGDSITPTARAHAREMLEKK